MYYLNEFDNLPRNFEKYFLIIVIYLLTVLYTFTNSMDPMYDELNLGIT